MNICINDEVYFPNVSFEPPQNMAFLSCNYMRLYLTDMLQCKSHLRNYLTIFVECQTKVQKEKVTQSEQLTAEVHKTSHSLHLFHVLIMRTTPFKSIGCEPKI